MKTQRDAAVNSPFKIIALWCVFLFGTVFHTQLGLIPLFHGLDVLAAHGQVAQDIQEIVPVLWLMLLFFLVPLVLIVGTVFTSSRTYRITHFWITVVYSVLNLAHLIVDLTIQPIAWYQITLMAFLLGVGLLLNLVGYQWMRESPTRHRLLTPVHYGD